MLVERDRVEAGAVASLLEQAGHQVARVAHSLDDALKVDTETIDFALVERELGEGTDATPIAEMLSAAGVPYAFIVRSGDLTDPMLFPGAAFVRKPLSSPSIEAAFAAAGAARHEQSAPSTDEALREAEIDLIKSKLQQTAVRAGPERAD